MIDLRALSRGEPLDPESAAVLRRILDNDVESVHGREEGPPAPP